MDCYQARLEHVPDADANDDLRNDWYSEVGALAEDAKKTRPATKKSPLLATPSGIVNSTPVQGNSQCPAHETNPDDLSIPGEF